MDTPRVLVLGDSFIRRLPLFLERNSSVFSVCLNLSSRAVIRWHGIGGRTVPKTLQHDLSVVQSFRPDIVILQLGSNDLTVSEPLHVGSAIEDFVRLLHDTYGIRFICVCQTINRQGATTFNRYVTLLTKYLSVVLEPIPYALFWHHRGFWKAAQTVYARDGVHLNDRGQRKLYRSIRGAILRSLSLLSSLFP